MDVSNLPDEADGTTNDPVESSIEVGEGEIDSIVKPAAGTKEETNAKMESAAEEEEKEATSEGEKDVSMKNEDDLDDERNASDDDMERNDDDNQKMSQEAGDDQPCVLKEIKFVGNNMSKIFFEFSDAIEPEKKEVGYFDIRVSLISFNFERNKRKEPLKWWQELLIFARASFSK